MGISCLLLIAAAVARPGEAQTQHTTNDQGVVYFADGRECTGRRPLPGKDGAVREGEPVAIEAGREAAFWLRQAQGVQAFGPLNVGEVCDVMVSFTPAAGASYRLTYRVSPDRKRCGAALARLEQGVGGTRAKKEPTFRVRKALVPSQDDRPACAPLKP